MPPKKAAASVAGRRNPPRKATTLKQTKLDEVLRGKAKNGSADDFILPPKTLPKKDVVTFEENSSGELVESSSLESEELEVVSVKMNKKEATGLRKPSSPLKLIIRKRLVQHPKVPPNTPQKKESIQDVPVQTPIQSVPVVRGHQIISPEIAEESTLVRRPRIGRKNIFDTTTKSAPVPRPLKTISEPDLKQYKSARLKASVQETERLKEDEDRLTDMILHAKEDPGIAVHVFPGKGRGLVARRKFSLHEYVVEYAGDLVSHRVAKQRERAYANEPGKYGCYMYFFGHKGVKWCVDATAETGRFGRLLNHSCRRANLRAEVKEIPGSRQPVHLILRAAREINEDEELLYDYGDRDPQSLAAFPWLKQ